MPQYWLVVTSPKNFVISRDMGFAVDGFKDNNLGRRVYGMKPGDRVVYYVMKARKFGSVTEVAGEPYTDTKRLWAEKDEPWPLRIPLKPEVILEDDQLVDVLKLVPLLSFVNQPNWGASFQGSLRIIPKDDFDLIASEIRRAAAPPTKPITASTLSEEQAKDKLDQARRFNYRKVIMVIEEGQLSKLNDRVKFDELRFWLDAWSIQAVYRLYTAGQEYFTLYAKLDESRYVDRSKLELVK